MDYMVDFILRSDIVGDESDQPNLTLRRDLANSLDIIKRRTHTERVTISQSLLTFSINARYITWICNLAS
jgi:hypothetical protein